MISSSPVYDTNHTKGRSDPYDDQRPLFHEFFFYTAFEYGVFRQGLDEPAFLHREGGLG